MEFLKDLWNFLRVRKKWWLAPLIIALVLLGLLIVIGGRSALAPFIYTLFFLTGLCNVVILSHLGKG